MYNLQSLTPDMPETPAEAGARSRDELAELRGENVALQSLLYGLCLGLSQMGEVQREVILQAFDYASRSPMALALKAESRGGERGFDAYQSMLGTLRELIVARIRSTRF